jgi:hypothetical protein
LLLSIFLLRLADIRSVVVSHPLLPCSNFVLRHVKPGVDAMNMKALYLMEYIHVSMSGFSRLPGCRPRGTQVGRPEQWHGVRKTIEKRGRKTRRNGPTRNSDVFVATALS